MPERVHLNLEWPEGFPPPGQRVSLRARAAGPRRCRRPGRDDLLDWVSHCGFDPNLPTRVRYVPVPAGCSVEVEVILYEPDDDKWRRSSTHALSVEPTSARAGDVLKLVPRPLASVILQPVPVPVPQKYITAKVTIVIEQRSGARSFDQWVMVRRPGEYAPPPPITLRGSAGAARLTWSGPGLRDGAIDDLRLVPGVAQEREMHLLPSHSWDDVRAAIKASQPERPTEPDPPATRQLRLEGVRKTAPGEDGPAVFQLQDDGELGVHELERSSPEEDVDWEEARFAVAFDGPTRASEIVTLRASGTTALRLVPAGLLVVVPERMPPKKAGGLHLQRADGSPIPYYELDTGEDAAGNPDSLEARLEVAPGQVIGPFPAGTIRFEVHVGKAHRGEVRATVRAGRITPLVVRW